MKKGFVCTIGNFGEQGEGGLRSMKWRGIETWGEEVRGEGVGGTPICQDIAAIFKEETRETRGRGNLKRERGRRISITGRKRV